MLNYIFLKYTLNNHLLVHGTVLIFEDVAVNVRDVSGIYIPSRETDT